MLERSPKVRWPPPYQHVMMERERKYKITFESTEMVGLTSTTTRRTRRVYGLVLHVRPAQCGTDKPTKLPFMLLPRQREFVRQAYASVAVTIVISSGELLSRSLPCVTNMHDPTASSRMSGVEIGCRWPCGSGRVKYGGTFSGNVYFSRVLRKQLSLLPPPRAGRNLDQPPPPRSRR